MCEAPMQDKEKSIGVSIAVTYDIISGIEYEDGHSFWMNK